MKILYLTNIRLPTEKAHGIQIMKTCEAMAQTGATVLLLVPRRRNPIAEDPFTYYGVQKNFNIQKIFCVNLLALGVFPWLGFLIESFFFTCAALFFVWREKPDVVYTRDALPALFFPYAHRNVFYEIHSLPSASDPVQRAIWKHPRGLVVISQGIKDELVERGIHASKIFVARDGVDIERFLIKRSKTDCRDELVLPQDKRLIVYTGHLYAWKGASVLARAAPLLPSEVLVFLVGGTAEDVQRFREEYRSPHLTIVGHRPSSEMPLWGRAADLLILPNSGKEKISTHYTSPLKLFEYMASGTPMIVSDLPSMREVLDDHDALFCPPDDPEALAKKIQEGLAHLTERQARSAELRERSKRYSWSERGRIIIDILSRAMETSYDRRLV